MFALDIRGHLNSLRLAESKALWPLFEAVVNSIQSIEDSPNRDNGKITIFAQREDQDPNLTIQKDVLERFESFVIEDNGNGMNTANYRSFNTAYSTLKIQKGCKGIGRFLWLKAFETVEIESVFQEDGHYYRRKFSFNPVPSRSSRRTSSYCKTDHRALFTVLYFGTLSANYNSRWCNRYNRLKPIF